MVYSIIVLEREKNNLSLELERIEKIINSKQFKGKFNENNNEAILNLKRKIRDLDYHIELFYEAHSNTE
jgi:hypothetical protein